VIRTGRGGPSHVPPYIWSGSYAVQGYDVITQRKRLSDERSNVRQPNRGPTGDQPVNLDSSSESNLYHLNRIPDHQNYDIELI